jgi:hypothetical protein
MAVACSWAKSIRPPIIAALRIGAEAQHTRDSNLSIGVSKSPTDERSLLRDLGCRVSQRLLGVDQSLFHKFIDFFD